MGDIDVAICEYIAENERVADLFNGLYFQGERRIHAENIEDYEEKYPVKYPTGGKHSKHTGKVRYRDIVKKLKSGGSLRILAMEKLFCVNEKQDFSCFHTELRQFFTMISCRKDWKRLRRLAESEDYRNLSADTAEAIAVVLGWSDPKEIQMKYEEKGKGVNMCKALEDLLTIEREKGEKLGIEQGIEQNAYNMIWNMQEEGIELDRICRISGKTAEEVQRILESK